MTGGTFTKQGGNQLTLGTGNTTGGVGEIDQSGGVFNNTVRDTWLGEQTGGGTGIWTLSGTAEANLAVVDLGHSGNANGAFNLDFNGGTLKARTSEPDFMSGLSAANVEAGGAIIDTDGNDIGIAQDLVDGGGGGGLTKNGAGTLTLDGANTYTGSTTVAAGTLLVDGSLAASNSVAVNGGTLGGTGTIAGTLNVGASGAVAPGTSVGTLSVSDTATISGTLKIEVDGATVDVLAVDGDVDISAATLSIVETGLGADQTSYTFLTYTGSLTGTQFFDEGTLPAGYGVDYSTSGEIKLVSTGGDSPFDTWAATGTLGPVTFEGDTNGDGVQDGIAFLLGVPNPDDDAKGSLPTASEDGAGGLVLAFNCLPTADRGTAELRIEHSSDLGVGDGWTATVNEVPDATNATADNGVTYVVTPGTPANAVVATIAASEAEGGKLFGRLTASE